MTFFGILLPKRQLLRGLLFNMGKRQIIQTTAAEFISTENNTEQVVEEVKTEIVENSRYVHPNPREFKGRLGYACLNTILRTQKPPVFSSRTCRLDTIAKKGPEYVKELALANVADMKTMIQWNEDNKIRFMRISSEMFPFASHEKAGYDIDFAKKELAEAGDLARKYNHRLTTHPGQFNQLVSLTPKVVTNTVRELDYHARMLDLMGMDQDSVMIIHMGGVYGDKESAIARFEKEYLKLPEHIKRRLVLENDEFGYSVSDLLPVCKKLKIPLVLDWHHHHINPGEVEDLVALLPEINQIWYDRGIKPKQHYSESRRGAKSATEMRAHSDRVQFLPPTTDDVDLMIEAKDKEQAVFHLYRLYGLETVNDDVWIPQTGTESLQTKGRKTHKAATKKRKVKEEKEEEVEAEIKIEAQEEQVVTPRRTSKRSAAAAAELKRKETEVEAIQIAMEAEQESKVSKKKRKVVIKEKKAIVKQSVTNENENATLTEKPKPKRASRKKAKTDTDIKVEPIVEDSLANNDSLTPDINGQHAVKT